MLNPFTYGNPISRPDLFIGREDAINRVYSRLLNPGFESSSIVGERRMGKTSLLYTLAHPQTMERFGVDGSHTVFVYLDLQALPASATPTRLWQRILGQIKKRVPDPAVQAAIDETAALDEIDSWALLDLFDVVDQQECRVVLLLDEFERVTTNENFPAEFFENFRSLAIHHNLALVLASRTELSSSAILAEVSSSPFFNIFATIWLRPFSPDSAGALLQRYLEGTDVTFSGDELAFLEQVAGRHPFFTQMAAFYLFDGYQKRLDSPGRLRHAQEHLREEAEGHFEYYWRHSDDEGRIVLTVLALLEREGRAGGRKFSVGRLEALYSRSTAALRELEQRSLLLADGDRYQLFSSVFAGWVAEEITDVMSEQQSYADWLNANQSALTRLSQNVKSEAGAILPKIKESYRTLVVDWLSRPETAAAAGSFLKGLLS